MQVHCSEHFVTAVLALSKERGIAALDAVERFKSDPSSPSLGFREVHGLPSYFVVYTRHGDLCILRKTGDVSYLAIDVGPYARVMDRAGLSAGS